MFALFLGLLTLVQPLYALDSTIHVRHDRRGQIVRINERREVFIFDSIRGPVTPTVLAEARATSIREYASSNSSALAIYLVDTNSNWLSLEFGLRSIGIPNIITTDLNEALQHRVVLAYPSLDTRSQGAIPKLEDFVKHGGTLIATCVASDHYAQIFGFRTVTSGRDHSSITFTDSAAQAYHFDAAEERTIPFTSTKAARASSLSYDDPRNAMAVYSDDRSAGIVSHSLGSGIAIAVGVDFGNLMRLGYTNREDAIARSYVNTYDPVIDIWLRFLKQLYEEHEPLATTLWPVPFGKDITVLMTHDLDYRPSMRNALDYARMETTFGIPATYFVEAKYIKDYNDAAFLDVNGARVLDSLREAGFEIANHSVAHSRQFATFALGTGNELYPSYQPFVHNMDSTSGATLVGEVRVSKYILEQLSGSTITSFRPGYLSNPILLPQLLQATGHRYSSSVTANNSLTHLPFQLTYSREAHAALPVFEFPITVEDREKPAMDERVQSAIDVANKLRSYGGLCNVLLHPSHFADRWRFEKVFVPAVQPFSYFATVQSFGAFWAARNEVQVSTTPSSIVLDIPEALDGLTLVVPKNRVVRSATPQIIYHQEGQRVILDHAAGHVVLNTE